MNKIEIKHLLDSYFVINETNGSINKNLMAANLNDISCGIHDASKDVKCRIKRSIQEAGKERFKKAVQALNDRVIANLDFNNIWSETLSKFSKGNETKFRENEPKPKFGLTECDAYKMLQTINPKSKEGKIGTNNKFILWTLDNEIIYGFNKAIYKLTKEIVENEML